MSNLILKKAFVAGGAIAVNRLVKFGADDNTVVVATAATDPVIGVSDDAHDAATGDRCDVFLCGIADVKLGVGGITRGLLIGSDATGQGVAVSTIGNRSVGVALMTGVAGDIVPVLLSPFVV